MGSFIAVLRKLIMVTWQYLLYQKLPSLKDSCKHHNCEYFLSTLQ